MKPGSNRWNVLDYVKVGIKGMPPGSLGGIDVTYRCNLRCRHCYFLKQNHREELSTEQWVMLFEQWKKEGFPFMICGWIGGEPLLRKELVDRGRKYFKSNVIFTNGTIELPPWPDVTFSVSVHGTEQYYYNMTGAKKGTYEQIKENVGRPELNVIIAFCITRLNYGCIEEMIEEWSKTNVNGIVFEFYTPMKSEDDGLFLRWGERDKIIDRIMNLKKTYGNFIGVSDRVYRLMKSRTAKKITQNCPFPSIGFSYDPMGRPKIPCQLGPEADCGRCGCILPFYSMVLTHRRLLIPEFGSSVFRRILLWAGNGIGNAGSRTRPLNRAML
ncbi:MAG: radical SAM protein [Deltaproteobacteria bacterium]|nr:radical SAM protein [Deltaproteobacteria bacterium]